MVAGRLWGLLGLVLAASASVAVGEPLERYAELVHGHVRTSRALLGEGEECPSHRLLSEVPTTTHHTWLVGLTPEQEKEVHATLTTHGGKVVHPLPGTESHHWVVHADHATIKQLLNAHPSVTAGAMPHELKVSPQIGYEVQKRARIVENEEDNSEDAATISLLVIIPEGVPDHFAETLLHRANNDLRNVLDPDCTLQVKPSNRFVRISVCLEGADEVAEWAAAQPGVTWVTAEPIMKHHNLFANAVTQAGSKRASLVAQGKTTPPTADVMKGTGSDFFPYWKAGLTGKGQIVSVVDTGLDPDSCFFHDSKVEDIIRMAEPVQGRAGAKVFNSNTHRKLVQIAMLTGELDTDGHGTHTAGTVAGSAEGFDPLTQPLLGTGVAPDAKLAIVDIGNDVNNQLALGLDPSFEYTLPQKAGARITSNSYGAMMPDGLGYGSSDCYAWDAYTWALPETLHIFSAGNEGDRRYLSDSTGTVGSPGICKNTLTVGAGESWVHPSYTDRKPINALNQDGAPVDATNYISQYTFPIGGYNPGVFQFTDNRGGALLTLASGDLGFYPQPGWISGFESLAGKPMQLVLGDANRDCQMDANYGGSRNPVVLLIRKSDADFKQGDGSTFTCTPIETAQAAARAGAAGVLLWWDNAVYKAVPRFNDKLRYPMAVINQKGIGAQLENYLKQGQTVVLNFQAGGLYRPTDAAPYENVADFSSFASRNRSQQESRIKPDLVAPGYVLSAYSDKKDGPSKDQCAVIWSQGTSMSAPVVSGAAALARQYFMDGFYPTGAANPDNKFTPSGPLLKAVLIAGTAAMQGYSITDGKRLVPPPSPFQGFGRLDLSQSLPLASDPPQPWRMQLVDSLVLTLDSPKVSEFTVEVGETDGDAPPFIATLVYHDFPAFPGNPRILVNDLDLLVVAPDGEKWWGNNVKDGDIFNNVEKVYIDSAKPGTYKVVVNAAYLFAGAQPQPFSLVVLGNLSGDMSVPSHLTSGGSGEADTQ